MKNLRDTCIEYLKDENTKKDVKEMMKPIFSMIYNEIYIYIWIIAFYNVFFLFILLGMFFLLVKLFQNRDTYSPPEIKYDFHTEILPELIHEFLDEFYKKVI